MNTLNFCVNCEMPLQPPMLLCEDCSDIAAEEAGDAADIDTDHECDRCGDLTPNFDHICDSCHEEDTDKDIKRRLDFE